MTRNEAKANLEKLGFTDVTDEQVTNYLNQLEGETNGLKTKLSKAEKDAQNVAELQRQLKELQDSKLTDEEKAQKAKEEKEKEIADLNAKVKAMELRTQLADKGITGEDADKLIESFGGGSLDVELLGKIITEREANAAKKKEEEIANHSTNPGGGGSAGDEKDIDKGYDEDVVNSVVSSMINVGEKSTTDIIDSYL